MSYVERLFALTGQNTVVIGGSGVLGSAMSEGLARAGHSSKCHLAGFLSRAAE